jgi:hypothetical protein
MLKRGTGELLIPEPLRSKGSAAEICRYVDWHHWNHYALGGTTDPRNISPLSPEEHNERTAKIDVPAIAKAKRLEKKEAAFRQRILDKSNGLAAAKKDRKNKIPSRPFPKKVKKDA